MRRQDILPGETYLSRRGGFLHEVQVVVDDYPDTWVVYVNVDTGRTANCEIVEFAGRCQRRLSLKPFTPPKRSNPDA